VGSSHGHPDRERGSPTHSRGSNRRASTRGSEGGGAPAGRRRCAVGLWRRSGGRGLGGGVPQRLLEEHRVAGVGPGPRRGGGGGSGRLWGRGDGDGIAGAAAVAWGRARAGGRGAGTPPRGTRSRPPPPPAERGGGEAKGARGSWRKDGGRQANARRNMSTLVLKICEPPGPGLTSGEKCKKPRRYAGTQRRVNRSPKVPPSPSLLALRLNHGNQTVFC